MFFVILIPLVHLLPNYRQLYSWKTYMLFKVNCYLCIFNTIRLVYYNLMICLKYHCKVILEEIDSFSTGRLFFFWEKRKWVYLWGVCYVVCLGHASSNHKRKWMSLWGGC
jgi:hypothetical protein